MILGILGLVCCGFVTGIIAVVLGGQAKNEIAQSHGAQTGEGMAKAGVILGWVAIALSILGIIAWIALVAIGTTSGTSFSEY